MGEIRVYEAARRLNVDPVDLINTLAKKGIDAKSPISLISQEAFDEVLSSMTAAPEGETKMEETSKPAGSETLSAEKERARLSLVTSAQPEPATAISSETDEVEDTAEPATAKRESVPPYEAPAIAAQPKTGGPSTLHYVTIGIASVALLAALVLGAAVTRHNTEIGKITESAAALKTEMTTAQAGIKSNQNMIMDTRVTVTELKNKMDLASRAQAKDSLMERSASLEELSATLPVQSADKMRNVAAGLNALASSM